MICGKVKEFLSQKGIEYTDRDVSTDDDALNELKRWNIKTTPVTVINGDAVIGFDQKKLEDMLKD